MANTKSAAKRARQSIKRHDRNKSVMSAVRTAVRKARASLTGAGDMAKDVRGAEAVMARAAAKGVMHKRTASRRTSRLAKAANKAKATPPKA